MSQALRLVAASALCMCVLVVTVVEPVAASEGNHSKEHKKSHAADTRPAYKREYLGNYAELVERHGVNAAGCNLVTDKYKNRCKGKTTKKKVVKSNLVLERMLYVPPPAPVPVPENPASAPSTTGGSGTYCGLFQFDQGTWESVGGSGSPCAASSSEQWQRARLLQQQRGNQPWPVCGANGASLEAIMRCESSGNPSAWG